MTELEKLTSESYKSHHFELAENKKARKKKNRDKYHYKKPQENRK